ncbi:TetR/AcrR family transcriptional regulator [Agarilytica rhodophyticola]|uniref:TetR/AcrR family transcriptional regulator n=1 Tax=Agarilytica rhodophyticola TaxID=1737490 RepID=UPI000B3444B0|nr:TetR family transcriptional regulator [Agarilytica rhodophyticola]
MVASRKEHLVETAQRLFYRQGFRATGIDLVLAESGVAKKTLYNHFKSKDELIIAALQRRDEQFMSNLRQTIARLLSKQEVDVKFAKISAYFDALSEWINSDNFCGCMFINASAEYPRQDDPIHVACTNHKKLVIQFIEELLSECKFENAHTIAKQMALLSDGAIVNAHTTNDYNAANEAKVVAMRLLESYCKEPM